MTMTTPHLLQMIVSVLMLMISSSSTLAGPTMGIENNNNYNFRSCDSRSTPPRGTYVAISRPCEFVFYKASSSSSDAAEDNGILSDVCFATDSSSLSTREEYALLWPDECTGSFIRCYNIKGTSDFASAYDFSGEGLSINITLALRQVMNWTVPDGATQLSVNCTADRAATEMAIDAFEDGMEQGLEGLQLIGKAIFFLTIVSIIACIGCCIYCCAKPPRQRQTQTSFEMVDQSKSFD
mmetsp:Transcript_21169/g.24370  ORF Transcript_21169/g.24370 Transcript_21169/m.24370 type:complete len:238 (-) Transcript_21169:214-927(-)